MLATDDTTGAQVQPPALESKEANMEKTLTVAFEKSLYREDAIQVAFEEYAGFIGCTQLSETPTHFNVELGNFDPDFADSIVDEFSNYVLFESITRSR